MTRKWIRYAQLAEVHVLLNFWRWCMIHSHNPNWRLHCSQICDKHILRYYALEQANPATLRPPSPSKNPRRHHRRIYGRDKIFLPGSGMYERNPRPKFSEGGSWD